MTAGPGTTGEPPEGLGAAAAALRAGLVVGIPTDTVYGLAADPSRPGATAQLFALKGRPTDAELPVLVADTAQAEELAGPDGLPPVARALVARFWPGALTIVVSRRDGLEWELGGTGDTIGLRCPASEIARALCRTVGPLATTSANRHGEPPHAGAAEVTADFPELVVVDGGRCDGAPSTVVDVTVSPPVCLRAGGVPWPEVEAVVAAE